MSFQVGPGMWVRLGFQVFDEEDEPVLDASQEYETVFGYGAVLPALEERPEGLRAADRRSISLPPERAFGRRRPDAVVEVDRADFPDDVAAGDRFEAESEDGRVVVLQVLEVTPEAVMLDANHPLAGQRLRFDVEVLEVRPAGAEELARAEQRLAAGPEPAPEPGDSPFSRLIPAESLLRPPGKR